MSYEKYVAIYVSQQEITLLRNELLLRNVRREGSDTLMFDEISVSSRGCFFMEGDVVEFEAFLRNGRPAGIRNIKKVGFDDGLALFFPLRVRKAMELIGITDCDALLSLPIAGIFMLSCFSSCREEALEGVRELIAYRTCGSPNTLVCFWESFFDEPACTKRPSDFFERRKLDDVIDALSNMDIEEGFDRLLMKTCAELINETDNDYFELSSILFSFAAAAFRRKFPELHDTFDDPSQMFEKIERVLSGSDISFEEFTFLLRLRD